MIEEYHRPKTIEAALELLGRLEPRTVPLAGGTALNKPSRETFAVVDLQELGLDGIEARGHILQYGAMTTLQSALQASETPTTLGDVIRYEATYNLRQVATIAGTLVAADGRSPLTTMLLALDAELTVLPGEEQIALGDLLSLRPSILPGNLVTKVSITVNNQIRFEYVARTPADRPIVCVGVASWPSGRTRVALGGYGDAPLLAFDGPDAEGARLAAESAYEYAQDEWATGEYRREIAGILTERCLTRLKSTTPS